jgi:clan AA aspartic protease (TIGR02281 family)
MTDPDFEIILPDEDKIHVCPKCFTHNPEESNFCLNCGFSLRKASSNRSKWILLLVIVLIFAGGMYYFHQRVTELSAPRTIPEIQPSPKKALLPEKEKDVIVDEDVAIKDDEIIPPERQKFKIPVGIVVIKDITGKTINEVQVPVVGGGWVALPTSLCLGGAEWVLKMGTDTELSIESGIVNDDDNVGLWRVMEDISIEGPELLPWSPEEDLTWIPLTSQESSEPVVFNSADRRGNFSKGKLSEDINESGIMLQQDRVVGWTFGDSFDGAFIWNGDESKYLIPEILVDDYYRITFANSREEEFTRALAMGEDYSDLERLEAFANSFRFDPKLSSQETPDHLQQDKIIANVRSMVATLIQAEEYREVANIFDTQILSQAADIELLMDAARATSQVYGFEDAIDLTDGVMAGLVKINEQETVQIQTFFSNLYQSWITEEINKGFLPGAWRAYQLGSRNLPDDVEIHLIGVQLALADNNWAEAERLLASKEYPSSLRDKVANLQAQISELKGQEGKIVINFAPGTRYIPVTAVLNRGTSQRFIVDTGASMVTIPQVTAFELGLSIDSRNPMRRVVTASGVTYAPEVTLSSITIEGWEVGNVKALVMDLPNQSNMGLLGLNYLGRFRMDINTEKGVMLLEPR